MIWKINAFDFDGVVSIGIHPGPNDVIVSGRCEEERSYVEEFLSDRGIRCAGIYLQPRPVEGRTREHSGIHKANTLIKLFREGRWVHCFFEDDMTQFQVMLKRIGRLSGFGEESEPSMTDWANQLRLVHVNAWFTDK